MNNFNIFHLRMTKRHADTDLEMEQPPLHRPLPMPTAVSYPQPISSQSNQPCSSSGIIYPNQVNTNTSTSQLQHLQPFQSQVLTSQGNSQARNFTSLNVQTSQESSNAALAAFFKASQDQSLSQQSLLTVANTPGAPLMRFQAQNPNILLTGQNIGNLLQNQPAMQNLVTSQAAQPQTRVNMDTTTNNPNVMSTQRTQSQIAVGQTRSTSNQIQAHPTLAATLNQPIQSGHSQSNLLTGQPGMSLSQNSMTGQPMPANQTLKLGNGMTVPQNMMVNMTRVPANMANLPNSSLGVHLANNASSTGMTNVGTISTNDRTTVSGLSIGAANNTMVNMVPNSGPTADILSHNGLRRTPNNNNPVAVMQSNGTITMLPNSNTLNMLNHNGNSTGTLLNNVTTLGMAQSTNVAPVMQNNSANGTMISQNNGNGSPLVVMKNGQVASNVGVPIIHNGNVVGFALDPSGRGRGQRPTMIQGVRVNGQPYMIAANGMVVPVMANQMINISGQGMTLPQGYVQIDANGTPIGGYGMNNGGNDRCNANGQCVQNQTDASSRHAANSISANSPTSAAQMALQNNCTIKSEINEQLPTAEPDYTPDDSSHAEPCSSASLDVQNNNCLAILPMVLYQQSQADNQPLPSNIDWNDPKDLMEVICTLCKYIISQASYNESADMDVDNPAAG